MTLFVVQMGSMRIAVKMLESLDEENQMGELGLDERIILKWVLVHGNDPRDSIIGS
jgi:hypothetical protein